MPGAAPSAWTPCREKLAQGLEGFSPCLEDLKDLSETGQLEDARQPRAARHDREAATVAQHPAVPDDQRVQHRSVDVVDAAQVRDDLARARARSGEEALV